MTWKRTLMTAGLALAATTGLASAQAPAQPQPAPAPAAANPPAGDLPGPVDSLGDLQDTGRMAFMLADTNHDGQISQKEAIDAGNLMVGGFFFRADQNGDGILSQDEANQARQAMFAQQPVLRYVIEKGKYQARQAGGNAAAANPAATVGNLLDANNDNQLQASEVRQAVSTAVQGVFAVADTNRDGQMSPTEINSAIVGAARTAAQAAFQQADADNNGSLSREEFDKAIIEPAHMVFGILDGDNNGQITQQEAQRARQQIASQMRHLMVPEPANSARNLIRSGASPDQVSPVPAVPVPAAAPRR